MTRTEDYDPGIGRSVPLTEADDSPWRDEPHAPPPKLNLPDLFLSLRQPWAWLVVNGWKNIENRTWPTRIRGRVGIHAAKGMTRDDYDACRLFVCSFASGVIDEIPPMASMERGGIVGETTILDCVTRHSSEWFTGPYGFVVADSKPLPFIPCPGALGFFRLEFDAQGWFGPVWGKQKED